MSSRSKGMKNERRAQKELEQEGWLVHRARGSTMYNREVDIFGIFDLCCLKNDAMFLAGGSAMIPVFQKNEEKINITFQLGLKESRIIFVPKLKLVQVKTNAKPNLRIFEEFKTRYPGTEIEVWIWYERGKSKKFRGWRKIIL